MTSQVVEKQAKYYVPTSADLANFGFYKKQMIQKLSTVEEASLQSRDSRGGYF
jgi:selenophosphate synthase